MRAIYQERSFKNYGSFIPYSNFIYGLNIYSEGSVYKERNYVGNIIYGYDLNDRGGIYNFTILEDKYNFKLHIRYNYNKELKKVEFML